MFFEEIENDVRQKEKFVQEQIRKEKDIYDSYNLLCEYRKVLKLSKEMMISGERHYSDNRQSINYNINDEEAKDKSESFLGEMTIKVASIVGTIERHEKDRFKKLVFRATRGNALTHFRDFTKPIINYHGQEVYKTVYVVMFPDGEAVKEKIHKL